MNLSFAKERCDVKTGGAYKVMDVVITVDARGTLDEQLSSVFYEVLSAYLDPTEEQRMLMTDLSDQLLDAARFVIGKEAMERWG